MKKLTILLICAGAIASGCAYAPPDGAARPPEGNPRQPVDSNRNSVPDNLERKAVPLEPIIERATPPAE